ncbi:hypothetical protein [Streptomyces griseosporeus]|uniref:hypothetical protein n=1 Tax=Streptomyces griseosporeus TaxID=1910 RepID=UPI0036FA1D95
MISEALDALITLGWAALAWLTILAAGGTLAVLGTAAALAGTWRRITRRPTSRPAWARNRRAARQYARSRSAHDEAA